MTVPIRLALVLLASAGILSATIVPAAAAPAGQPAKKVCGKKQKPRKKKRKRKAKKRPCLPAPAADAPEGYHPRAWLFWRTTADVDLHVFDALGNHSSPANLAGIPGTVHGPDGSLGIGIDTGPNESFMEKIPMTTRTFYVYACLDTPAAEPTRVEAQITDSVNSYRIIPQFFLTNDGQEFEVGRTPAFASDPSFPIPPLCP